MRIYSEIVSSGSSGPYAFKWPFVRRSTPIISIYQIKERCEFSQAAWKLAPPPEEGITPTAQSSTNSVAVLKIHTYGTGLGRPAPPIL
ncbi:hypothetical protein EVAR_11698_1 [Eumeta japonica]|uniref:Uncharacterized protein n=1 Tax=Eumeta variegata TaxID=151549 RepID=A0A4C1U4J1_EUMVA|nr:hypothetical protein EVAR_11698_1 [Eumeta japonica]